MLPGTPTSHVFLFVVESFDFFFLANLCTQFPSKDIPRSGGFVILLELLTKLSPASPSYSSPLLGGPSLTLFFGAFFGTRSFASPPFLMVHRCQRLPSTLVLFSPDDRSSADSSFERLFIPKTNSFFQPVAVVVCPVL